MSGSGISWAICKSAPCSRQMTTPASHHSSFLQAGCPTCYPTNSVKALKAKLQAAISNNNKIRSINMWNIANYPYYNFQLLLGIERCGPMLRASHILWSCLRVVHTSEPCKTAELIEMPFGGGGRLTWAQVTMYQMTVHPDTTWQAWLNNPCAAAMRPCNKQLLENIENH